MNYSITDVKTLLFLVCVCFRVRTRIGQRLGSAVIPQDAIYFVVLLWASILVFRFRGKHFGFLEMTRLGWMARKLQVSARFYPHVSGITSIHYRTLLLSAGFWESNSDLNACMVNILLIEPST